MDIFHAFIRLIDKNICQNIWNTQMTPGKAPSRSSTLIANDTQTGLEVKRGRYGEGELMNARWPQGEEGGKPTQDAPCVIFTFTFL